MNTPATDVATAQSFDVSSFLGNVVQTAGNVIAARVAPTQNTGQPSVSNAPSQTLTANGQPPGSIMSNPLALIAIGGGVLLLAVVILRKS